MPFADDRFKKVKVLVMHDGLNLNGSVFSMEAMEKAKESIKNIPILAFVKQQDGTDEADFGGHESEVVFGDDGIKFRYLGRPIGIIPADANDYHYEIYDNKTFVAVTGYIWTDYANEALDILESSGEKGQSMEIRVDDGDWDDFDNFNITSYRYTGVTILGDNVTPAMTGAKVQLFSADSKTFSDEYFAKVDELNVALKNYASQSEESEGSNMEDKKEFENTETPVEGEGTPTPTEGEGSTLETNSVEGDEPKAEGEGTPEGEGDKEVPENVEQNSADEGKETPAEPVDYSAQITTLNTELFNLKQLYDALETEAVGLREYKRVSEEAKAKAEKDAEFAKKQAIFAEFSVGLTDEEMQPIKDKVDELSAREITDQLNAIFTAKNLAVLKAKKFSNDAPKAGVVIDVPKKDNPKSRYAV
jgi:hypothetical protein